MFVSKQELQGALGTFKDKKQQKFYEGMCKIFSPLEQPKPGDWLHGSKQAHQSYMNYRLPFYNPVTTERNTIYIQQFDQFNQDFIKELTTFCSLFYPTLYVKCLPVLNFQKQLGKIKNRQGYYRPQYLAQDILAYLEKRVPKDAYCVMGITLQDIYPGDSWLFVYGWAKYKARVGIFSFLRFDEEFRRKKSEKIDWGSILYPSMRTMAHEIGHMFGITHCVYYRCLMNGFNGILQNYSKPFQFCPICYRKISTNIGFNFIQRYSSLIVYCSKSEIQLLKKDSSFYQKLLKISQQNIFKIIRQVVVEPKEKKQQILLKQPIKKVQKPMQPFKAPIKQLQPIKAFPIMKIEKPSIQFSVAKTRNGCFQQQLKKIQNSNKPSNNKTSSIVRGSSLYTKNRK